MLIHPITQLHRHTNIPTTTTTINFIKPWLYTTTTDKIYLEKYTCGVERVKLGSRLLKYAWVQNKNKTKHVSANGIIIVFSR